MGLSTFNLGITELHEQDKRLHNSKHKLCNESSNWLTVMSSVLFRVKPVTLEPKIQNLLLGLSNQIYHLSNAHIETIQNQ